MLPFAVFETYRQQVGKELLVPSYSRSDETIPARQEYAAIRSSFAGPTTPPPALHRLPRQPLRSPQKIQKIRALLVPIAHENLRTSSSTGFSRVVLICIER